MFTEKEIKASLVDWLFEKGFIHDAVIINEMVVANWSRRADIAVANGRLYGFEIKSSFDTLKRLPGQLESFQKHFDKVYVVAASKFVSSIERDYPSEIGILEVHEASGKLRLRQVRAGRIREIKDPSILASHITKSELEKFVKHTIGLPTAGLGRIELVRVCSVKGIRHLREYVLKCIKSRYSGLFYDFLKSRERRTTEQCLNLLSKSSVSRATLQRRVDTYGVYRKSALKSEKAIDFSLLGGGGEAFDFEMPQSVLIRRKC